MTEALKLAPNERDPRHPQQELVDMIIIAAHEDCEGSYFLAARMVVPDGDVQGLSRAAEWQAAPAYVRMYHFRNIRPY